MAPRMTTEARRTRRWAGRTLRAALALYSPAPFPHRDRPRPPPPRRPVSPAPGAAPSEAPPALDRRAADHRSVEGDAGFGAAFRASGRRALLASAARGGGLRPALAARQ